MGETSKDAEDEKRVARNAAARDLSSLSTKELEIQRMALERASARGEHEMTELAQAIRGTDEQVDALRQRTTDVLAELSDLQGKRVEKDAATFSLMTKDTSAEKLMSYRDAAQGINTAFKRALRRKLEDPEFIGKLTWALRAFEPGDTPVAP